MKPGREKSCKKEGRARGFRVLGELSSEKVVRERASEEKPCVKCGREPRAERVAGAKPGNVLFRNSREARRSEERMPRNEVREGSRRQIT